MGEVGLINGIVQGDAFSPLLFVLMIDPVIKVMKTQLGDRVEILYYTDDLKVSTENVETDRAVHGILKKYALSLGMVINNKSAIQMDWKPHSQSLSRISPDWMRPHISTLDLRREKEMWKGRR